METFKSDTVKFFLAQDDEEGEKKLPEWVQLMSEYKFHVGWDREGNRIERNADKKVFKSFIKNFKAKVKGTKCLLDYGHRSYSEPAAAEVLDLKIEKGEDGKDALFIKPKWTPKAEQSILDGEWHYLSSEFSFVFADPETGEDVGPTLIGGGLTNRPRIKNMKEVYQFDDRIKEIITMSDKEKMAKLEAENKKLKEKMAAMDKEKEKEMSKKNDDSSSETQVNSDQSKKIEELETRLALSEKMKDVTKLFDEGKLHPEQLKLAQESKSPAELDTIIKFAEKSAKIKTETLSENGGGQVQTQDNSEYQKFDDELQKNIKNGMSLNEAASAAYEKCDDSKFEDSSIPGSATEFMPEADQRK